eukprot:6707752-Pyramimonas_sp.AAC.1
MPAQWATTIPRSRGRAGLKCNLVRASCRLWGRDERMQMRNTSGLKCNLVQASCRLTASDEMYQLRVLA